MYIINKFFIMDEDSYLTLLLMDYILNKNIKSFNVICRYKSFLKIFINHSKINYELLYNRKINVLLYYNEYKDFYKYCNYKLINRRIYKSFAKYVFEKYIFFEENNKNDYYISLFIKDYVNDRNIKSNIKINNYKSFLKSFLNYYNMNYELLYNYKNNNNDLYNIKDKFNDYIIKKRCKDYKYFAKYVYKKYLSI